MVIITLLDLTHHELKIPSFLEFGSSMVSYILEICEFLYATCKIIKHLINKCCTFKFEFNAQPHLYFLLTQRVAPATIRHFLQSGYIVLYHSPTEKPGKVTKESTDCYLAREIMSTRLHLEVIFDECQPYPKVIFNFVELLLRRFRVDGCALVLDKKKQSAFYERYIAFMRLETAT